MINKKSCGVTGIARAVALCFALSPLLAHSETPGDANPIGHFEISHYEVQGNTLLSGQDIDQMLAPFTGKEKDFGSVQMALETLEAAYRSKGYDLVRVTLPEQELNHGVVTLKVIEFKIGKISVEGNKFFSDANIKNSLPALQSGQIPLMRDVSANLKIANEDPSKKTTVQLQNGNADGTIDAVLKVEDQKTWSASVGVDNTGDDITGRNRLSVMVQNADIGGWDHVLSMQYTTSFAHPNDVNVVGLGYHVPLYALADSMDFYASYSNVNSGMVTAGVFDLAVSGSGTVAGLRYNHHLPRVGDYDSTLSGGLDYKIFNNDVSLVGLPLGGDISVHPASLIYAGNWSITGLTINFSATLLHNIPGGDDSSPADFSAERSGATPDYSILRYGASLLKTLPYGWQIRSNLTGQQTSDSLIPGEQIGIGGANSVRGFNEREIAEDIGRTTNFELYTPGLCGAVAQCRILAFYDTGYAKRNDPLPGELAKQSIASAGVGFRVTRTPDWLLQADYAHVIDGTTISPKGTNRVEFKLVYTF